MRSLNTIFVMVLISISVGVVRGQFGCSALDTTDVRTITNADLRSNSAVDLSKEVVLRIATRKVEVNLGEIVSIDIAALNSSRTPFWLKAGDIPTVLATSRNEKVPIIFYSISRPVFSARSFCLVQPHKIIRWRFNILLGCDERAFERAKLLFDEEDDLKEFERDLFVYWGDACVDLGNPASITFQANLSNEYVVSSANNASKTAIGRVRSNILRVQVEK